MTHMDEMLASKSCLQLTNVDVVYLEEGVVVHLGVEVPSRQVISAHRDLRSETDITNDN